MYLGNSSENRKYIDKNLVVKPNIVSDYQITGADVNKFLLAVDASSATPTETSVLFLPDTINQPAGQGRATVFSKDNKYLAVSHNVFPYVTIYDTTTWTKILFETVSSASPPTNNNTILSMDFSYDGTLFALGLQTAIFIWETTNWTHVATLFTEIWPSLFDFGSVEFSPDNSTLVVPMFNDWSNLAFDPLQYKLRMFSTTDWSFTDLISTAGFPTIKGRGCSYSPDGQYLAAVTHNSVINVYETTTYTVDFTLSPQGLLSNKDINSISWCRNNTDIIVFGDINTVQVYEIVGTTWNLKTELNLSETPTLPARNKNVKVPNNGELFATNGTPNKWYKLEDNSEKNPPPPPTEHYTGFGASFAYNIGLYAVPLTVAPYVVVYNIGNDITSGTVIKLPELTSLNNGDIIYIKKVSGDYDIELSPFGTDIIYNNYLLSEKNDVMIVIRGYDGWDVISNKRPAVNYQPVSNILTDISNLSPLPADKMMYFNGSNLASMDVSVLSQSILASNNIITVKSLMDIGTVADYDIGTSGNTVPLLSTQNTWQSAFHLKQGLETDLSVEFGTGNGLYNPESGAIGFVTDNQERIRLKNDTLYIGNLLWDNSQIGIDSYVSVSPNGLVVSSENPIVTYHDTSYSGSNYHMMFFNTAFDTNVAGWGGIEVDNTGVFYHNTSDYRLKENIKPITNGLEKIKTIKARKFNFKKSPHIESTGFIAQELQETIPEAVVDNENSLLSVDTAKLVPYLVASLKEISKKINVLEQKIKEKKGK